MVFPKWYHGKFESDLQKAMTLVRFFRLQCVRGNLDARAVRVAIIVMKLIDDYLAKRKISDFTDKQLEIMASKLFEDAREDLERKGWAA